MLRRDGNQSGSKPRKKKPSAGGHPSRGGVTVGGGTTSHPKLTTYKKPPPGPSPGGHPSRGGITVRGGTKKHPKISAYVPTYKGHREVDSAKGYRRLLKRQRMRMRGEPLHGKDPHAKIPKITPRGSKASERKDVERFDTKPRKGESLDSYMGRYKKDRERFVQTAGASADLRVKGAIDKGTNFGLKALAQTARPIHGLSRGEIQGLKDMKKGKAPSLKVVSETVKGVTEDPTKHSHLGSDVLKEAGVKNKTVRAIVGTGIDIVGDPLTYTGFGIGTAARKIGTKAAEKKARKLAGKKLVKYTPRTRKPEPMPAKERQERLVKKAAKTELGLSERGAHRPKIRGGSRAHVKPKKASELIHVGEEQRPPGFDRVASKKSIERHAKKTGRAKGPSPVQGVKAHLEKVSEGPVKHTKKGKIHHFEDRHGTRYGMTESGSSVKRLDGDKERPAGRDFEDAAKTSKPKPFNKDRAQKALQREYYKRTSSKVPTVHERTMPQPVKTAGSVDRPRPPKGRGVQVKFGKYESTGATGARVAGKVSEEGRQTAGAWREAARDTFGGPQVRHQADTIEGHKAAQESMRINRSLPHYVGRQVENLAKELRGKFGRRDYLKIVRRLERDDAKDFLRVAARLEAKGRTKEAAHYRELHKATVALRSQFKHWMRTERQHGVAGHGLIDFNAMRRIADEAEPPDWVEQLALNQKKLKAGLPAAKANVEKAKTKLGEVEAHIADRESRGVPTAGLQKRLEQAQDGLRRAKAGLTRRERALMDVNQRSKRLAKGYTPHTMGLKRVKEDQPPVDLPGGRTSSPFNKTRGNREKISVQRYEHRDPETGETLVQEDLPLAVAQRGLARGRSLAWGAGIRELSERLGRTLKRGDRLQGNEAVYLLTPARSGGTQANLIKVQSALRERVNTPIAVTDSALAQQGYAFKAKDLDRFLKTGRLPKGHSGRLVAMDERLADESIAHMRGMRHKTPRKVVRKYRRFHGGIKTILTIPMPSYHIRNFYGDSYNSYLRNNAARLAVEVPRASKDIYRKLKHYRGLEKQQLQLDKRATLSKLRKDPVMRELLEAEKYGAVNAGFTLDLLELMGKEAEVLRSVAPRTGGVGRYRAARSKLHVRNVGQYRENVVRFATYRLARQDGKTPGEAAMIVNDLHFDYGFLNDTERAARDWLPFYTFSARNTPLQARKYVSRPGKFANYEKVLEEGAKAAGVYKEGEDWRTHLKDYQKLGLALPAFGLTRGGLALVAMGGLPMNDLSKVPAPGNTPGNLLKQTLSMLTPGAKIPLELNIGEHGYSFFFRGDIDTGPRQVPTALAKQIKRIGPLADFVDLEYIYDKKLGKKVWKWNGRVDYVAKALPESNVLLQMGVEQPNRRGQDKALKTLSMSGMRLEPFTPLRTEVDKTHDAQADVEQRMEDLRDQGIDADHPNKEYKELQKVRAQIIKMRAGYKRRLRKAGDMDIPKLTPEERSKLDGPAGSGPSYGGGSGGWGGGSGGWSGGIRFEGGGPQGQVNRSWYGGNVRRNQSAWRKWKLRQRDIVGPEDGPFHSDPGIYQRRRSTRA